MSLSVCPLQEICPKYSNSTKDLSHYVRLTHPCNDFLAFCCEIAMQLEMFLSDKPIACDINKGGAKRGSGQAHKPMANSY